MTSNGTKLVYVSRIGELLKLKSRMRGVDISIRQFADDVGVSHQTAYTWMSQGGVMTLPRAEHQQRLCDYFGVRWYEMWDLRELHEPAQR